MYDCTKGTVIDKLEVVMGDGDKNIMLLLSCVLCFDVWRSVREHAGAIAQREKVAVKLKVRASVRLKITENR